MQLSKTRSGPTVNSNPTRARPRARVTLDLFRFTPFRLNRLAAEVSAELSSEYRDRYGLDIPEWRVMATLGFQDAACSAQYISHCTRTHKSTISRAVTTLLKRRLIERVANGDDRREFKLRLSAKGRALYEELTPQLLRKERDILSCLSADERRAFARLLGKIEQRLGLIQAPDGAACAAPDTPYARAGRRRIGTAPPP